MQFQVLKNKNKILFILKKRNNLYQLEILKKNIIQMPYL